MNISEGTVLFLELNDEANCTKKHMYIVDKILDGITFLTEIVSCTNSSKPFPVFLSFKVDKNKWNFLDNESQVNFSPFIFTLSNYIPHKSILKRQNSSVFMKNITNDPFIKWKHSTLLPPLIKYISTEVKTNNKIPKFYDYKINFNDDKFLKNYLINVKKLSEEEINKISNYLNKKIIIKFLDINDF